MVDDEGPRVLDVPIGIEATGLRTERDAMGAIEVPADRYWGAQTQRSLIHFEIGPDRMPPAIHHAYGLVKASAARANADLGLLPGWLATLIERVAGEVADGALDDHFPLYVYQTGSGTQSNMNVNEVISNRAIQLLGGVLGSKEPVHPNDHVNMSQSSNDTFPTAMHVATVLALRDDLLPATEALRDAIAAKAAAWSDVVKTGRTHLQDATPVTVGQEWSGYVGAIDDALDGLRAAMAGLYRLAIGGTAVGTGINAPAGFGATVAAGLAARTGAPFVEAPNHFAAQATSDAMVRTSGALRGLAVALFKFANDLRWLGSGPRAGLHELVLPANEPGSSIMPGKVNPTQAEAMLMVCIDVIGADTAVAMAGAEGNFELHTFRPPIAAHVLRSVATLADTCDHSRRFMVEGMELDRRRIADAVDRSVMLVTALSPLIGYDAAAAIAHHAVEHDVTLRDAALALGVDADLFDEVVVPERLTRPNEA